MKKENIEILENKFKTDFHNHYWFKCGIEELRRSTIFNQPRREVDNGYIIILKGIWGLVNYTSKI